MAKTILEPLTHMVRDRDVSCVVVLAFRLSLRILKEGNEIVWDHHLSESEFS